MYRTSTSETVVIKNWGDVPGALSDDRLTYIFPIVHGTSKTGKTTRWIISIRIYRNRSDASIDRPMRITDEIASNADKKTKYIARILVHYKMGDGTATPKEPTFITEGKNIGRANETNVFCQALRDAFGLFNKQRRRASDVTTDDRKPRPMLARLYSDVYGPHDDPTPIFVQRKYNGVRAVSTLNAAGEPIIYSRKGLLYEGFRALKREIGNICNAWSAGAINDQLKQYALYLDGELYQHGRALQYISGIVRRARDQSGGEQDDLKYIVYDMFLVNPGADSCNSLKYDDRRAILRDISAYARDAGMTHIEFAETFMLQSGETRAIDQAAGLYTRFLTEGYEGAIIRLNAPYEHSVNDMHSRNLLKMKPIHDSEFRIVDYTTGLRGKASGALLFVCETSDGGARFTVTPTGTIASRIQRATEFARVEDNGKTVFENSWYGRPLTVMYAELSPTGVPLRATTDSVIREYE